MDQHTSERTPNLARYSRQMLFEKIGEQKQQRLHDSRVTLIGCGALGTILADTLVRAGVGFLRICDRDFIEIDNLQRQVLFDEDDVADQLPKAQAAARKLNRINSQVTIEPAVINVHHANIDTLCDGADLILDGTDNFETRFLINDLAVKTDTPWVYGAAVGATGICMPIIPHDTPCLRCVFDEAPPPEMNPTCDTAGVLAMTVNIVASLQAVEAIKLLTGARDELSRKMMHIDVWTGRFVSLNVQNAYDDGDCRCCKHCEYDYLSGRRGSSTTALCGRNAVQVNATRTEPMDFAAIARKLEPVATAPVTHNAFLLKARVDDYELTLFADGRAIIKGTDDRDLAQSLYARYFGL